MIVHADPQLYNAFRGLGVEFHSHSDTVSFVPTFVLSMKSPAAPPAVDQSFLTTALLVGLSSCYFPSMLKMGRGLLPPFEGHTKKFLILHKRGL